jgi:glycosyltransferase involved in cell wall biosynthesis
MMPEMSALIEQTLSEKSFDVVHLDHSQMGRYGLWIKERHKLPIVLREHNFEAMIYERFAKTEPNPLKAFVARVHGKRLKREEATFLASFEAVAAISNEDVRAMRQVAPDANYHVIPAGVDTDFFQPSATELDENSILSIGPLGWDPNFDALRYFLESVFPKILQERPQTVLHVVGSDPQRALPYAKPFGKAVILHGRVPDVRDYFARAAVVVVPLRIGGGMRVKLLELFAAGKAVVSTSIGAEGNRGEDNVHLMLRDDAQSFASAVAELLGAPALRNMLGQNARKLAIDNYSWSHIAREFAALYERAIARREAFINAQ